MKYLTISFNLMVFLMLSVNCLNLDAKSKSKGYSLVEAFDDNKNPEKIKIDKEIARSISCTTKEDCISIVGSCPFGCQIAVNKIHADKIKSLMRNFKSNCMYKCGPWTEADCVKGRCIQMKFWEK